MKLSLRLLTLTAAMLLPMGAVAAMANVTGITADIAAGGRVRISWQKPAGEVSAYRVYYSHASILQNGGKYDDFETVPGTQTDFTFATNPQVSTLFASVLAVNPQGEESPLFMEEASVNLQGSFSQLSSQSTSTQDAVLRLLTVRAVSATGVILNFSQNVVIDPQTAAQAFDISDGSGAQLVMRRLVIDGKTVTIHTVPQVRSRVYLVRVGNAVQGRTDDGRAAPLDPQQTPVLFTGSPDGIAAGTSSSSTTTVPGGARDVTALRLTAIPDANGTYTVEASWMNPAGITGLRVAQTSDGGKNFWAEQQLSADTQMLRVRNVPGGSFGIRIRTIGTDSGVSQGTFSSIDLPRTIPQPTRPTGGGSTRLPNSGFGLAAAVILAGAGTGFWEMRRRRAQVA
jgi:hypothetical protein